MTRRHGLMSLCTLAMVVGYTVANDANSPKTLMTTPGKQLFADELNKPLTGTWKAAKGKWEVVDGAMKVSEIKADMHGAVARTPLKFQNAVIQFDFKLDGAKNCSFSINDATGHLCRVTFNSAGFSVNKDKHDKKDDNDKGIVLERKTTPITAGEWHTMVIEISGNEMIATLDGKTTAIGQHQFIGKEKANIGLTVAGETASYRQLKIWEATPKADWEKTKAKLQTASK